MYILYCCPPWGASSSGCPPPGHRRFWAPQTGGVPACRPLMPAEGSPIRLGAVSADAVMIDADGFSRLLIHVIRFLAGAAAPGAPPGFVAAVLNPVRKLLGCCRLPLPRAPVSIGRSKEIHIDQSQDNNRHCQANRSSQQLRAKHGEKFADNPESIIRPAAKENIAKISIGVDFDGDGSGNSVVATENYPEGDKQNL